MAAHAVQRLQQHRAHRLPGRDAETLPSISASHTADSFAFIPVSASLTYARIVRSRWTAGMNASAFPNPAARSQHVPPTVGLRLPLATTERPARSAMGLNARYMVYFRTRRCNQCHMVPVLTGQR